MESYLIFDPKGHRDPLSHRGRNISLALSGTGCGPYASSVTRLGWP